MGVLLVFVSLGVFAWSVLGLISPRIASPDYSWRPRLGPWEATPEPDSVADSGK